MTKSKAAALPLMRSRWWALALAVAVLLSGCTGAPDDTETGDSGEEAATTGVMGEPVAIPYRDVGSAVLEETYTITVQPQDACIPTGCPSYTALGGQEASFIKILDIEDALPQGMHAYVEIEATWEEQSPINVLGFNNMQWWSSDVWVTWCPDYEFDTDYFRLGCFVTNHGPAPAEVIYVALEPQQPGPYDVTVNIRSTPILSGIGTYNVGAINLVGGAVPLTITHDAGEPVQLIVKDARAETVLDEQVTSGDTVVLPADSAAGKYMVTALGPSSTVQFAAPAEFLRGMPVIEPVDTTVEVGQARDVPEPSGRMVWDVDLDEPPLMVGIRFDALDGRSTELQAQVTIEAPDGTVLTSGTFQCNVCLFSASTWTSNFADAALTAGTYTFTVEVQQAQGWTVWDLTFPYALQ